MFLQKKPYLTGEERYEIPWKREIINLGNKKKQRKTNIRFVRVEKILFRQTSGVVIIKLVQNDWQEQMFVRENYIFVLSDGRAGAAGRVCHRRRIRNKKNRGTLIFIYKRTYFLHFNSIFNTSARFPSNNVKQFFSNWEPEEAPVAIWLRWAAINVYFILKYFRYIQLLHGRPYDRIIVVDKA